MLLSNEVFFKLLLLGVLLALGADLCGDGILVEPPPEPLKVCGLAIGFAIGLA